MDHVTVSSTKMFGTPPEPLFCHKLCGATPDMLQDWLNLLIIRNSQAVDLANPVQGYLLTLDCVQYLFLTCERLKMSSEVKYLSLELFDRFMLKHLQDLHEHVLNSTHSRERGQEWVEIKGRVNNQVVLRILSCIQIASKLTSHYRILGPNKAKRFLMDGGHCYNLESILQSELRILKTLSFNVSIPSPLVYLEALLEVLGQTDEEIGVKILHGVSLNLLDMVYLQHSEVYSRLHQLATNGSPIAEKDRDKFSSVRADKMLLMATLITAAAYIVNRDVHEKVMVQLSQMTRIPAQDIADFCSIILQLLMEASED